MVCAVRGLGVVVRLWKSAVVPKLVAPVVPPGSMATRAQPVLAGGEVSLRPWTAADVPDVVAAYADPAVRHWHLRTMTRDEAEAWVLAANQGWSDESAASWAVTIPSRRLAGRMTLGAIDLDGGAADVRYWVVPSMRGRGVASRALNILTDWAITDLGLHRLELEHSTSNLPSCRVAARAGYALEGTRRSQVLHEDGWHDLHLHARLDRAGPR